MVDWPLTGRDADLAVVFDRLDQQPPRALVVAGSAGVGKSRLVREAAARADERGWTTRMIVGTKAASPIPFGALASLVDDRADAMSSVDVLRRARSALTAADGDPPVLLVVDDAQRLDAGSAALVHQVVADGVCRTLATVRSGESVAEVVQSLWTGGWADRIELAGLSEETTGALLAAALGAPVDGATLRRLWDASRGNVLYLKEIVAGAVASGVLHEEGRIWRMRGAADVPPRLVELIQARTAGLDADARHALDVLAVAERLDLEPLTRLADLTALEHLEDEGFVEVMEDGGGPVVTLAHPLYGEAVRARMPALRRRRVCGAVADAVEQTGMTRAGDLVRVATWRLDAGQAVDPGLLTKAARHAYNANDLDLAERLATTARTAGAGVEAGLVLAEALMHNGRPEDADAILAALEAEADDDRQRVDVADSRTLVLGLYLGREQEAMRVVEETLAVVHDEELVDPLLASAGIVFAQIPRPAAAIETVRPLLERPDGACYRRGTYAASIALAVSGSLDEAIDVGFRGHAAHVAPGELARFRPEAQFIGPVLALCGAGRSAEAMALAAQGYDAALAADDSDLQAAFALLNGLIAVHQGRLRSAARHFDEAAALNREVNDVAAVRWALGGIALAAGMRSDRVESAAAVAEIAAQGPPPLGLFELDLVERGRAWALAADGELARAIACLRTAAERAAESGLTVVEALLRHDVVRLGGARTELAQLEALAERVDGQLVAALADHARALVAPEGERLETAAARLAALGLAQIAHEAALDAAAAWRTQGMRRRAAACEQLAREQELLSESSHAPTSRQERPGYATLTAREREVASMAARDLSSREIAEKLYLSPRTVENHLQRVYDKLGVSSRQELDQVLKGQ